MISSVFYYLKSCQHKYCDECKEKAVKKIPFNCICGAGCTEEPMKIVLKEIGGESSGDENSSDSDSSSDGDDSDKEDTKKGKKVDKEEEEHKGKDKKKDKKHKLK